MSALAVAAATAASLGAIAYLAATDPKRRRAFGLGPRPARHRGLAWAAVLLPGVLLPIEGGAGGFFTWLGAVTVLGWVAAATSPGRADAMVRRAGSWAAAARSRIGSLAGEAGRRWRALPVRRAPAEGLEARIERLEAEVAALRARFAASRPDDVVVELPRAGDAVRPARRIVGD